LLTKHSIYCVNLQRLNCTSNKVRAHSAMPAIIKTLPTAIFSDLLNVDLVFDTTLRVTDDSVLVVDLVVIVVGVVVSIVVGWVVAGLVGLIVVTNSPIIV